MKKTSTKKIPTKNPSFPLISIIIPIYNAENFLEKTITSCLEQDYPNLEILLINDGSTDGSKFICEKYQKAFNFIHFYNLKHQGVSTTRNFGLDHFSGNFFCFLDADDFLAKNFISTLFSLAKKYQLDYITSSYHRFVDNKKLQNLATKSSLETTISPLNSALKSRLKSTIPPLNSTLNNTKSAKLPLCSTLKNTKNDSGSSQSTFSIYQKSDFYQKLLDLHYGYNFCHMKLISKTLRHIHFDESLSVAEDALYNFQLLAQLESVGVTSDPLYFYRVHQNSTVRTYKKDYVKSYHTALRKIETYLKTHQKSLFQQYQKHFYAFVATHLFFILANFCCHKDNNQQIKSIKSLYKIPLFSQAIYLAPLCLFPPPKAFVLFCFKFKFFHLLRLIGRLRAKQNSQ